MTNTQTAAKVYATTESGWRVTSPASTAMGFAVTVFAPGMPDDCPDAVFYGSLPEDAIRNGMKFATHDALAAENAALREALTAYIDAVNEALTPDGCADVAKWDKDGSAPGAVGKLMDCEKRARAALEVTK